MKYVVDRIEENIAVIQREDGKTFHIPLDLIPEEAREGDIIQAEKGSVKKLDSATRETEMVEKLHNLFHK